ncbi:hypothetical protein INR49_016133 [Caranx melampygus]|nr:hypothetical protein INR49_016133 [Caranx melampygus]
MEVDGSRRLGLVPPAYRSAEHSDPMLKKRDDFEDILEERRNSSDLRYALRCYAPVVYKGVSPCKADTLKSMVLQSDQLHFVINQLQQAIQEHPVVLLPSHRSYMDFLLMSYILYTYDLALPVIAAGMDFMGMKFVGEMLRMSGAFFIRRSFGGDKLYWAVFSEYVKTMLKGLFKARKVLSEDYGSIHVYFGQPVSVRSLAEGRVNRCQFNLIPRHIPKRPSEEIQTFVNDSAYRLVRAQEENMVLKPWVLLVSLLLQNHHHQNQNQNQALGKNQGMSLDELTEQAVWLRDLSRQYGAFLHWPDHVPPSEVVSSSLSLHRGLVKISEGRVQLALDQAAGGGQTEPHSSAATPMPEEELLNRAVVVLSCASYRNQVLHIFLRPALLASAVHAASSTKKQEVFNSFSFLRNMFSNEFILCPGATVQDFEEACYLLEKTGALQVSQQEVLVTERGHRTLSFLTNMLDPFLQGYQVVCRFLCEEATEPLTEKRFIPAVRKFIIKQLLTGRLRYSEVLSSDLQKNSLAALLRLGAVRKTKGYGGDSEGGQGDGELAGGHSGRKTPDSEDCRCSPLKELQTSLNLFSFLCTCVGVSAPLHVVRYGTSHKGRRPNKLLSVRGGTKAIWRRLKPRFYFFFLCFFLRLFFLFKTFSTHTHTHKS